MSTLKKGRPGERTLIVITWLKSLVIAKFCVERKENSPNIYNQIWPTLKAMKNGLLASQTSNTQNWSMPSSTANLGSHSLSLPAGWDMIQNALELKTARKMGVTVIRPYDWAVSNVWNGFTISVEIIVISIFVVLEGFLNMDMKKKIKKLWPTAVHFDCGSGVNSVPPTSSPFFPSNFLL